MVVFPATRRTFSVDTLPLEIRSRREPSLAEAVGASGALIASVAAEVGWLPSCFIPCGRRLGALPSPCNMDDGSSQGTAEERCARLHQLEEELERKLLVPLEDLTGISSALQQMQLETAALDTMTKVSWKELEIVTTPVPATEDVLEHCTRGVADLKAALSALSVQLDNTRRFVGTIAHAHHQSVMPWLSPQELECIKELNPFVPVVAK